MTQTRTKAIRSTRDETASDQPQGGKKVRLEDVARAAEVSLSAASMALSDHPRISEATKQRVRQVSRDLGYRSPREQTANRRRLRQPGAMLRLGFLLIGNRLQDDVNVSLLHGLTAEASARHVRIELGAIEELDSQQTVTQRMLQFARELDGILVCGHVDEPLLEGLREAAAPHVVMGQIITRQHRYGAAPGVHVVAPDDMAMGFAAGVHLLGRGGRRIAFVAEPSPPNMCHDRWLSGLRLAHAAAGVPFDKHLVISADREPGHLTRIIDALLALSPAIDGLVTPQTRLAASLLPAMAHIDRPLARDAVVVGGSEEMVRRHNLHTGPSLCVDAEALAAAAIDRLVQLIHSPQTPPGTLLMPHLPIMPR